MPTAWLLQVLRRSEDGCCRSRLGRAELRRAPPSRALSSGRSVRIPSCPSRRASGWCRRKVHVIPPQTAPRRDTTSRSLGHDQREFEQRVNLIRHSQQPEINFVQHHRPLWILLAWESDAVERVFLQEPPPVLCPFPGGPIQRPHRVEGEHGTEGAPTSSGSAMATTRAIACVTTTPAR